MKILFSFFLFTLVYVSSYAQEITMFPGSFFYEYYQDDQPIDKKTVRQLMENVPNAHLSWEKSRTWNTVGLITLGGAIVKVAASPSHRLAKFSFIDLGLGILLGISFEREIHFKKKAILTYNAQFDPKTSSIRIAPQWNAEGLGIAIKF